MKPFCFIQLADPQFGMSAAISGKSQAEIAEYAARGLNVRAAPKFDGLGPEIKAFEEAIAKANRLRPGFVVVCGDMVNDPNSSEERQEVQRIAGELDSSIPIYWIAGNHDIGADTVVPTRQSIKAYRDAWGDDYYAFQHGGASFVALNTSVMDHPEQAPDELDAQMRFLEAELRAARKRGSAHVIVFTHYPFFLRNPDEPDGYFTVARERRAPVLELLRVYGVSAVFAGHWHRNNYASDGDMLMVASGPVGYPLGDDPSGYRVVEVLADRVAHTYHALGNGLRGPLPAGSSGQSAFSLPPARISMSHRAGGR